jgi:hypothetical protein
MELALLEEPPMHAVGLTIPTSAASDLAIEFEDSRVLRSVARDSPELTIEEVMSFLATNAMIACSKLG